MYNIAPRARFSSSVGNGLFNSASLDLHFAKTKSLVDATTGASLVTFTRASSGTFVGSDGVLQSAVTNLRTFSDAILVGNTYGLSVGTLTTVTIATPTASATATQFTLNVGANTGNNTDGFNYGSAVTLTNSTQHTQSLFVKPAGATVLRLRSNVSGSVVDFTLTGNGAAPSPSSDIQSASIVPFPNGWYRVSWTFTTTTSAPGNRNDYWTIKTNVADGTNGLYVVGAQLEQSSTVGEYIPTTSTINSAPRFDHNPTTGESLGLLVEEARTNLALRSEEFSAATWVKTSSTVTANTGSAPDGTTTADTFTRTTTGPNYVTQNFTKAASAIQYTCSVFAKQSVGNFCAIRLQGTYPSRVDVVFNLSSATISTAATAFGSFTGPSASITPYANGWYRLTVTGTSDATIGLAIHASFNSNGAVIDGNDSVSNSAGLLWGAQLEAGAFATSYIPTTTATVTRAADVASITGTNFSSWYNQTEGTMFVEYNRPVTVTGLRSMAATSNGGFENRTTFRSDSATVLTIFAVDGSVGQATFNLTSISGANNKAAVAYQVNNYNAASNGILGTKDTVATVHAADRLSIGSVLNAEPSCSYIRRLCYWSQPLAGSTLQGITQ